MPAEQLTMKKKRGRETLLTPALQKRLCKFLADANTISTSAAACGISERTFFRFREEPAFLAAVSRARAKAKAKLVKVITDQAPRDWRAAAFLLARSWPKEYGQRVEITEETAEAPRQKGCTIYYDVGNGTLAELLDFPKHPSLVQHERDDAAIQLGINCCERRTKHSSGARNVCNAKMSPCEFVRITWGDLLANDWWMNQLT
jgi:hypothetical protein